MGEHHTGPVFTHEVRAALIRFTLGVLALAGSVASQESGYESYFGYLGTYPDYTYPGFHDDVQGVTHDDDFWYFSNSDSLWRVALGEDLANEPVAAHTVYIDDAPMLAGYNHFGDMSYRDGYLLIPVTELDSELPPMLAVYEAPSLVPVGIAPLLDEHGAPIEGGGWVAIDPDGTVYVDHAGGEVVYRYVLAWDLLPDQVVFHIAVPVVKLKDWNGSDPFTTPSPQGGVFSPTGDLLYISSGGTTGPPGSVCPGGLTTEEMHAKAGINVFDTTTWTRVAHSSSGGGLFNYTFDPGLPDCEEPEGLTIWDLEPGQAPGSVHGQLHVLVLDNDYGGPADPDQVLLKHYTHRVNVTPFVAGHPYKTIAAGHGFAWNGSVLAVVSASYPESVTLDKRVLVEAVGGPVVIGK